MEQDSEVNNALRREEGDGVCIGEFTLVSLDKLPVSSLRDISASVRSSFMEPAKWLDNTKSHSKQNQSLLLYPHLTRYI